MRLPSGRRVQREAPPSGRRAQRGPGDGEPLRRVGYVRVEGGGLFQHDVYVEGPQVAEVAEMGGGVVNLTVRREDLVKAD